MKKISLTDLILRAMEHYQMDDEYYAKGTSRVPGNYRKAFIEYLKSVKDQNGKTLLENAIDTNYNPSNSREKYYFTEQEVSTILYSDRIRDYCIKHSTSDDILKLQTSKELSKKAEDAKAAWYKFLSDNQLPYEPYIGQSVMPEDISEAQTQLMIKALFELFYTPISEQFGTDMTTSHLYGGDTATPQSIECSERFANPENYYKPNIDNKVLDKVLDKLADKIAERLKSQSSFL